MCQALCIESFGPRISASQATKIKCFSPIFNAGSGECFILGARLDGFEVSWGDVL